MSETTPFKQNRSTKKIMKEFERVFAWTGKKPTAFTLTRQQYNDWWESLDPDARKFLTGNPKYRGIEIKKMGEA